MYLRIIPALLFCFTLLGNTYGQTLKEQINNLFGEVLELELSPGEHKTHFLPVNVAASRAVIATMNNFIGSSVSSLPLSSSTAGITFDFSTGRPVPTSTSFGPIYSERAQTVGKGRINMGVNYTYLDFTKLRGIPTDDLRLTFTHEDVGAPGLGDSPNEFDTVDLFLHMNIKSSVLAIHFTYGITDQIDIGVAIPFTNVSIKADPFAKINSFTWVSNDSANHFFGGTRTEPQLTKFPTPIDDDATGVGDIALRLKFNLVRDADIDFGAMLEYRMSSGDAENFLGAGYSSLRTVLIGSKILDNFAPHFNLSYRKKFTDLDRDVFEYIIGYDQKISGWFTFVLDILGRVQLGEQIDSQKFPDNVNLFWTVGNTDYTNSISLTNVPNFKQDNIIDVAFGAKIKLKESLLAIGNVFIPLNDDGLRAGIVSTIGMEFSF